MSPEQARGREADVRSGIWAFGCALYEMLTARRAFGGDSVTDILGAVLKEKPDLDSLPASPPLRRLVERSIEKDARRRCHIGDVRIELADLDSLSSVGEQATSSQADGSHRRGVAPWATAWQV